MITRSFSSDYGSLYTRSDLVGVELACRRNRTGLYDVAVCRLYHEGRRIHAFYYSAPVSFWQAVLAYWRDYRRSSVHTRSRVPLRVWYPDGSRSTHLPPGFHNPDWSAEINFIYVHTHNLYPPDESAIITVYYRDKRPVQVLTLNAHSPEFRGVELWIKTRFMRAWSSNLPASRSTAYWPMFQRFSDNNPISVP